MANAIDLPAPSKTPSRPPRESRDNEPVGPDGSPVSGGASRLVCEAISAKTREPCAEKADREVVWGDGTKTRCCSGCASYYVALAQEHKCPTYVHVTSFEDSATDLRKIH